LGFPFPREVALDGLVELLELRILGNSSLALLLKVGDHFRIDHPPFGIFHLWHLIEWKRVIEERFSQIKMVDQRRENNIRTHPTILGAVSVHAVELLTRQLELATVPSLHSAEELSRSDVHQVLHSPLPVGRCVPRDDSAA